MSRNQIVKQILAVINGCGILKKSCVLTSEEQVQILCQNTDTDATTPDLRRLLRLWLQTIQSPSLLALQSYKSKINSTLQKKQGSHFVGIFKAVSSALSTDDDIVNFNR